VQKKKELEFMKRKMSYISNPGYNVDFISVGGASGARQAAKSVYNVEAKNVPGFGKTL